MMKEQETFDDLIFENRNKEYGAYEIRKKYPRYVLISLCAAVLIGSAVVVIPFISVLGMQHNTGPRAGGRLVSVTMEKIDLPEEQIYVPPEAPPPPPSAQAAIKYVAPIVADTVLPTDTKTVSVAEVQAAPPDNNNQEITASSNASDNELVRGDIGDGGDEPFILVEVKPTFKGGDIEKFREWIQKRVVYPQEAQDNGIQGRVYLTFIVERDGSVNTVTVVKGVDKLIDDEARKAILASPKWTPGLQRGRPVRVRYSIFLNFTL